MKSYFELDAWKESKNLTISIYNLTASFPNNEIFGIVSQMRRAALSVPSNIAEGIGRQTKKDTVHFLYISKGSLNELETQVIISCELGFLIEEQQAQLLAQIVKCKQLISGLIKHYKTLEQKRES